MKLLNRTRIPDEPLRKLLIATGRAMGARTGEVVVQINPARTLFCASSSGMAYNCDWVRWADRKGKRIKRSTNGGAFRISISVVNLDTFGCVQSFWKTSLHEWHHIREYQSGGHWTHPWSKRKNGRRPRHKDRPEEQRAEDAVAGRQRRGLSIEQHEDQALALMAALDETYHH